MTENKDNFDDLLDDLNMNDQIKHNLGFTGEAVTYVGFIGDHSGSMSEPVDPTKVDSPIKKDLAMSNFNEQIATLKDEADDMETLITVVEFDNELMLPYENVDIEEVKPLEDYWTRGMTSLYDAIAFGISRIQKVMDEDDRENKAALMIIETDGWENSSADYRGPEGRQRLSDLIKELEATGKWTFTFLGAGLDEKFAQEMGMQFGNIATTRAGNLGDTVHAYSVQNAGLRSFMDDRKKGITSKADFYTSVDGKTKDEG